MLTLAQASIFFDRTEVRDPFTGALLFRCQIDPFEDTKRDAYSAYRRVMSTAPGTAIPAHRTLDVMGSRWIAGTLEVDGMQDLHREKRVLSPVHTTLNVSSLGQYLSGVSARQLCAAAYWNKDAKQTETSSEQPQMYDVFLPDSVGARTVLWDDDHAYLVLSPRPAASGLACAFSLLLANRAEPATLTQRTFDPVAGAYTGASETTVPSLRVRWQSLFSYDAETDERYQEGDLSLVVPAGCGATTSSVLTVAGKKHQVLGTDTMGDALVLHARRIR